MVLFAEECATDDGFPKEFLEPSVWVKRMIKGFGKYVGFPIDSSESQCIVFFTKLEKVREEKNAVVNSSRTGNKSKKGTGELRSLVSSINYDRKADTNSKGSLKSIGLGSDQYP